MRIPRIESPRLLDSRHSCGLFALRSRRVLRGMTLIDVVVGVSVMLIVFLGIFSAFKLSIELVFSTKAKAGGIALVTDQLEYIRGLSYETVGTVGGIPAGAIPQLQQTTLNGIPYIIRTLVQYVDAPEDGLGSADSTGITADYKSVKVEASWIVRESARSAFAVTRISPVGIESLGAGGTLRVNVFDALAAPVSGAVVTVVNSAAVPAISLSLQTDEGGSIVLPGAPVAADYQVSVIKAGHSSSTTYTATVENPNPNPGNVAVANQQTTTVSLAIDLLGALRIFTFSPAGPGSFDDPFDDESNILATSSVVVVGGAAILEGESGTYVSEGTLRSTTISPAYLVSWNSLTWSTDKPAGTDILVQLYYYDGVEYVLVPDTDVPGNGAGLSSENIDLSALAVSTYGSLRMEATLSTGDPLVTPELRGWTLAHTSGPTPLPGVAFDIHGAKTIGTTGGGLPLYKMNGSDETTEYGEYFIDPIEWDAYELLLTDPYDIVERCPNVISVAPGVTQDVLLYLAPDSENSVRVVVSGGGASVSGATVSLAGSSVDETENTSACGQAFFGDLPEDSYTITIDAPGYQQFEEVVAVSGEFEYPVTLVQN